MHPQAASNRWMSQDGSRNSVKHKFAKLCQSWQTTTFSCQAQKKFPPTSLESKPWNTTIANISWFSCTLWVCFLVWSHVHALDALWRIAHRKAKISTRNCHPTLISNICFASWWRLSRHGAEIWLRILFLHCGMHLHLRSYVYKRSHGVGYVDLCCPSIFHRFDSA